MFLQFPFILDFSRTTVTININIDFDNQGARMTVRYGTPQFLIRSTVRLFCNGTSTVLWYSV